jgi:hypothetical protein
LTSRITGWGYRVLKRGPLRHPVEIPRRFEMLFRRAVVPASNLTAHRNQLVVKACENRGTGCRKERAISPEELPPLEEVMFESKAGRLSARVDP